MVTRITVFVFGMFTGVLSIILFVVRPSLLATMRGAWLNNILCHTYIPVPCSAV